MQGERCFHIIHQLLSSHAHCPELELQSEEAYPLLSAEGARTVAGVSDEIGFQAGDRTVTIAEPGLVVAV